MYEVTYILGGNIELDVEFTYIPGKAAVIHAPVEQCHPAEDDEIDIQSVTCNGKEVETDDIYVMASFGIIWVNDDILDFISTNRSEWLDQ